MRAVGNFQAVADEKSDTTQTTKRNPPRHLTTRDCPRVTLRFSLNDYEKLQQLADGMALAVYIRAGHDGKPSAELPLQVVTLQ